MDKNQHRWKLSVDSKTNKLMDDLAQSLQWAWRIDMQTPKSYPVNTDYAFGQIKTQLAVGMRGQLKIPEEAQEMPPPPPPPECLSQLVAEGTIKTVYEQQNDGSYEEALKQAANGTNESYVVWRKIWRAIDTAYQADHFGIEVAPMPRVQFLHRKLLEVANLAGLGDLVHDGLREFFDDVCPCGKKHEAEAVRKLRGRWTVGRTKPRS